MITAHFPNPDTSPTGAQRIRIRYTITRDAAGTARPTLTYAHGAQQLDVQMWGTWSAAGAVIVASSARDRQIVGEALRIPAAAILEEPPTWP